MESTNTGCQKCGDRWETVRELFEECHDPGASVDLDGQTTLQKIDWKDTDHTLWRVYVDDQYATSIRISEFRDACQLQQRLDEIKEHSTDSYQVPHITHD